MARDRAIHVFPAGIRFGTSKAVMGKADQHYGPNRLLFGSDSSFFPRGWNHEVFAAQTQAMHELGIGAADAQQILGGNLRRILTEF